LSPLLFQRSEIVTIIESSGAIGIYHTGYSAVSKAASKDYLDRVFVDMMWYKAFSVYLILRMKINVLFQDADLVWFKDPFPYFHNFGKDSEGNVIVKGSEHIEAFFSDDGQRSLRYSPFYANSGFYYLKGDISCLCLCCRVPFLLIC
jgi:Nucleotide-diphospho-sugar transferase